LKVTSPQTDQDAVTAFKGLLSRHIDPNGGTNVNLRFKPNHPDADTGPDGYNEL